MTIWEALAWSVLRAAVVGAIVGWLVTRVVRLIDRASVLSDAVRLVLLAAALIPVIAPGLLIGYAYRPEGLRWVLTPWKADLLQAAICIARTLPWGLLVAFLMGAGASSRSRLTWEQTRSQRTTIPHLFGACRLWLARYRSGVVAGLVAAMVTFGEAEVAALLQARGWPEWTFQKLRGGWAAGDIAVRLLPVVLFVGLTLLVGWRLNSFWRVSDDCDSRCGRVGELLAGGVVGLALVISTVIPLTRLVVDAASGLRAVAEQTVFWREVVVTIVAAAATAALATWLARHVVASRQARVIATPLILLGALGSLMVSVLVQSLPGRALWETVVPQYVALGCVLLPLAVLLELALTRVRSMRSYRVSSQLMVHHSDAVSRVARRDCWQTMVAPRVCALGLLYWVAFWDLQTSALLSPPGWATAPGRLYNLAHYGQSETLAAMLLVLAVIAFALPAIALFLSYRWTTR